MVLLKITNFFECPEGYGIYVQRTLIVKKLDSNDPNANFDFMDEEQKYEKEREAQFQQLKDEQDKLRLVKHKFMEMDTDGNRSVDVEEWLKMTKEIFPQINEDQSRGLFRQIDLSDSGEISYAEFDAWIIKIGGIDQIMAQIGTQKNGSANDEKNDQSNGQSTDEKTDLTKTQSYDQTNDQHDNETDPKTDDQTNDKSEDANDQQEDETTENPNDENNTTNEENQQNDEQ